VVEIPFDGFTQEGYAQKMIDEYKAAGLASSRVYARCFLKDETCR
jgi:glycerophosphoryl diester phosphodiesterase